MAETLQEFLVRVRYDSDQASQTKMLNGIASMGNAVFKMGAAIIAGVSAAAYGTKKYAETFNDVARSAERINTTVKAMRSMASAANELGSSSDSMLSSLEAVARFQKMNPWGAVGLMRSMGANVKIGDDAEKITMEMAAAFQRRNARIGETKGTQLNLLQGEQLGYAYKDILAMQDVRFKGLKETHDKAQAAEKYIEAGAAANKGVIALDVASDHVASNMSRLMVPAMETGTKALDSFSDNIDGAAGSVEGLTLAIEKAIAGITASAEKTDMSSPEYKAAHPGGFGLWDAVKQVGGAALFQGTRVLKSMVTGVDPDNDTLGQRKKYLLKSFEAQGMTRETSAGLLANMLRENSTLDPTRQETLKGGGRGPGYGLLQWTSKDRKQHYKDVFGVSLEQDTNPMQHQAEFIGIEAKTTHRRQWAEIEKAKHDARLSGELISRKFVAPMDADRQAELRGRDAESINRNYNTIIHVHGVEDPNKVVKLIEEKGAISRQAAARPAMSGIR